ncbi:N-acetylmuramoyl-L-alanine amidase [Lederbergia sp. NSJ-179]|uniref:N-acetylmuramoyl-L-alanine amidase n=1 Tax=Lederbergia sp. NSJ-179 TaxID=2931402 RepID=UPI001FD2A0DA|nr:N-acetylmuramoyl-L-alanine amidase [Lederbergia sp. NSJ-179]MCJ7841616.1 N-acetylmuramoyl-L-alanine amidase [Lederbergia sp. NSJ-179]
MNLRPHALLTFFISTFFLFHFIPSAHAKGHSQVYIVGTTSLNIRSAPSNSATIIGQLSEGDRVVAFQESFGWVQTYYDGQVAWVASHFLLPAGSTPKSKLASNQTSVTVTTNEVRIRTGPGTAYNIIGSASRGDRFDLIETSNDWHKISLADGSTGWIAAWLTNTNTESQPAENSYSNPFEGVTEDSLEGYNIVIDPGHGGKDPGSIGIGGNFEKRLTLMTANKVAHDLREAGATVIITREDDYFISLKERVRISNSYHTHAFISIHYNASPRSSAQGLETYYYHPTSRNLAESIQNSIVKNTQLQNRGIQQSNYYVLRENSDKAVLVELGFITNPYDFSIIQTEEYQKEVAEGITSGLKNYFESNEQ